MCKILFTKDELLSIYNSNYLSDFQQYITNINHKDRIRYLFRKTQTKVFVKTL
jgi:hypothetical protein